MPRTLQDDIDKNVKPWPEDWDLHIIKSSLLIFDAEEGADGVFCLRAATNFTSIGDAPVEGEPTYELLRETIDLDSISLRIVLEHDDRYYICHFNKDGDEAIGNLFHIHEESIDDDALMLRLAQHIRGNSGYDCVKKLIEAVIEDARNSPAFDMLEDIDDSEFADDDD